MAARCDETSPLNGATIDHRRRRTNRTEQTILASTRARPGVPGSPPGPGDTRPGVFTRALCVGSKLAVWHTPSGTERRGAAGGVTAQRDREGIPRLALPASRPIGVPPGRGVLISRDDPGIIGLGSYAARVGDYNTTT